MEAGGKSDQCTLNILSISFPVSIMTSEHSYSDYTLHLKSSGGRNGPLDGTMTAGVLKRIRSILHSTNTSGKLITTNGMNPENKPRT